MTRQRIGFIDTTTPTLELNLPFIDQQEPTRVALEEFLGSAICDLAAAQEAGYRAIGANSLAQSVALSRLRAGCISNVPPDYEITPPVEEFTGGQCVGVFYNIEMTSTFTNPTSGAVQDRQYFGGTTGPIIEVRHPPTTNIASIQVRKEVDGPWIDAGGGTWATVLAQNSTEPFGIILTRQDGQPDDCGDSPLTVTTFPPQLEPPSVVPAPGDIVNEGEIININIDVGGQMVPVSVEVPPVVFEPDRGLCIQMPGLPIAIQPDFGIDLEDLVDIAAAGQTAANGVGIGQIQGTLMCVEQSVCPTLDYSMGGQTCDGTAIVRNGSTSGLQGVIQAVEAAVEVLEPVAGQYCDLLGGGNDNVAPSTIISYTVASPNETGIGTPVGNDVLVVGIGVQVSGAFPFVYRGTAGINAQGRFGIIFFGEEINGVVYWGQANLLYLESCQFSLPIFRGNQRFVRYSGEVGTQVQIIDTGVR